LIRGDEQLVQNNCLGWSSAVQISAWSRRRDRPPWIAHPDPHVGVGPRL